MRIRRKLNQFSVTLMGVVFLLITLKFSNKLGLINQVLDSTPSSESKVDLARVAAELAKNLTNLHRQDNPAIKSRKAGDLGKNVTILYRQVNPTKIRDAVELTKNLMNLHTRDNELPQKCKIPILDPYHPDVKPFIKRWSIPDCKYPELSEVTDDGLLRVSTDINFSLMILIKTFKLLSLLISAIFIGHS